MPDNKPISGVLSINKPPDMTSHDVVEQVRRLLNIKYKKRNTNLRVGHTGTLDPFATGVLLVAIGSATRLIEYSHDWNKEYETVITLGAASDTDDVTGKILKSDMQTLEIPKIAQIQQTLKHFVGIIKQVPPAYSAIKIKGERSYKLARQGSDHSLPTKEVNVFDLQLIEYKYPHLTLRITCSTGTYIRSLARDIGQALGTGAYVKQLDRIRVGPHKIENSVKLHILTKDYILRHLLPTAELVSHLPTIVLPDDNVAQFYKGQKIEGREVEKQLSSALNNNKITRKLTINKHNGFVAIFNDTSTLLGIGYYDSITHLLHPKKVIPLPSPFI